MKEGFALYIFASVLSLALLAYIGCLGWRSWKKLDELKLKDRFAARNDFVKTMAQILGGAFFLITIYVTYQNLLVSEKNLAETQEKNKADLAIARDKQTTELYVKAIEQLGSEKLQIRLGGVYALERIARESAKDHWTIMEVLTAFVRENAPLRKETQAAPEAAKEEGPYTGPPTPREKPRADIQAVLTVLGRTAILFAQKGEKRSLDLQRTHLAGADLILANLQRAYLPEANLQWAALMRANFEGAFLCRAELQEAVFAIANLKGADLEGANLQRAILGGANLQGASLKGANLQEAFFGKANLQGANLQNAQGLTAEWMPEAIWDETTKWPEGFSPPPRRGKEDENK
jgi:hypothetical protein